MQTRRSGLRAHLSFLNAHKRAIFYCAVSTLGALCYGYDQIYYTGVQGMQAFINDYGTTTTSTGEPALTTSFLSLTTSIIYVGELVGALLAAPINDWWGRKAVFYFASVCIIVGAVVQLTAAGDEGLIVGGRILIGLGVGQFTVTCLLYIGEVAPLAIRGPALMMFQFMQSCSQLVGSGITQGTQSIPNANAYLIPFGLLIALPGVMLLSLPFIPESPVWYASKGKVRKAEDALRRINGERSNSLRASRGSIQKQIGNSQQIPIPTTAAPEASPETQTTHRPSSSNGRNTKIPYDPAHDLQAILDASNKQQPQQKQDQTHPTTNTTHHPRPSLFSPIERRKLLFSAGAMIAQQITGIQFFYSYGVVFAQSLLGSSGSSSDPAFTISLITNVLQVISVLASVLLGNRISRRRNLLLCTLGLWVGLLVVGGLGVTGAEILDGGDGTYSDAVSYSIVVFSYLVIVFFNFSLGPLCFTIASEMAVGPNRNRIMSASIVGFFVTVWVITFVSPYMYYDAGLGPMLGFVYAGTTAVFSLPYLWFCVGETRGRSGAEIERFFVEAVPVREWEGYDFEDGGDDGVERGAVEQGTGEVGVGRGEETGSAGMTRKVKRRGTGDAGSSHQFETV